MCTSRCSVSNQPPAPIDPSWMYLYQLPCHCASRSFAYFVQQAGMYEYDTSVYMYTVCSNSSKGTVVVVGSLRFTDPLFHRH